MRAFEIVVLSRTLIYLLFSFIHFTLCANTSLLCCAPLWTGTVKTFSGCQRSMQFGMHPGFLPTAAAYADDFDRSTCRLANTSQVPQWNPELTSV